MFRATVYLRNDEYERVRIEEFAFGYWGNCGELIVKEGSGDLLVALIELSQREDLRK